LYGPPGIDLIEVEVAELPPDFREGSVDISRVDLLRERTPAVVRVGKRAFFSIADRAWPLGATALAGAASFFAAGRGTARTACLAT